MSFRLALIAAVSLSPMALAACGGTGEGGDSTATNVAVPQGDYVRRMLALNEGERNAVLLRAIRDAGHECQGVERSAPSDPVEGNPAWIATCQNQSEWLVVLGENGMATVTTRQREVRATRP